MSKIEKLKLENGLTIYLYEEKRRKRTLVNMTFHFGGLHHDFTVNKKKYHIQSGVAHFLEHYLLEHTKEGNLINKFGNMHLRANAVTSIQKTEYYFSGVVNIEKALKMLISNLHSITFTKEDVEETKNAIYEEIRMGEDHKGKRLFTLQNKSLFQTIPYKNTIGSKEDIKKIDVKTARLCYEAFYRPENESLFIAGNFDKEKILEIIKKEYQKIKTRKDTFSMQTYQEQKQIKTKNASVKMEVAIPITSVCYKIDISHWSPKERLKLDFYLSYFLKMNVGRNTVWHQKISQKEIITGDTSIDHIFIENICIISIKATTNEKEKFVKEVVNQIQKPVWEEELFEIYKRDSMLEIASRKENIDAMIMPFLDNIYTFSYEKEDTVQDIKKYTFQDFKEKIKKLSWGNPAVFTVEKKIEKKESKAFELTD